MKRNHLLTILEAALTSGDTRYAREAAQQLLAAWPGDLSAQMALARARLAEGETQAALDVLEGLVAVDPEHAEAQRALGALFQAAGRLDRAAGALAAAHVVDGQGLPDGLQMPAWAGPARAAMQAAGRSAWREARAEAERALQASPDGPLPSLLYLLAAWRPGESGLARPLAEGFHARWPGCVAFSLCLAECLRSGAGAERQAGNHADEARAIALLHEAGALDSGGDVVSRYWGASHPYRSLWPNLPDPELPGPLPKDVSRLLGMNRLRPGEAGKTDGARINAQGSRAEAQGATRKTHQATRGPHGAPPVTVHPPPVTFSTRDDEQPTADAPRPAPDSLAEIRAELSRIEAWLENKKGGRRRRQAKRAAPPAAARTPGTHFSSPPEAQPAHVILTSRTRLVRKFGDEAAQAIAGQLAELADASAGTLGGSAFVVYVDDRDCLRPLDLRPADPEKPWEVKLLVRDVAAALGRQGKQVTSVLIAGGDDIVPFHRLPNPVDDVDGDVPSDNPYATADDNYLIPEWAVGRLPAPEGGDPAAFSRLLSAAIAAHRSHQAPRAAPGDGAKNLLQLLIRWLASGLSRSRPPAPSRYNFGYTARVWHAASSAVFAAIGEPDHLSSCPPLDVTGLPPEGLLPTPLSYFNLHGVEDGAEWYGQRDADDPGLPQFPIALRPASVANSGRAPGLVFTEACYGANILRKGVEDALCLKFLDSGTRGVVGSTRIAYGSISAPLIGADLLGRLFWDSLNEGLPAGEALRRAKLAHARQMHVRQGFLDGEDQKTLVSFVLYGDPLLPAPGASQGKTRRKTKRQAPVREHELTLLSEEATATDPGLARPEAVAHIKNLVERHLPGMREPDVHVARQRSLRAPATSRGSAAAARVRARAGGTANGNLVFTLSKSAPAGAGGARRAIAQFVRVTVNKDGKVIKMAVSR